MGIFARLMKRQTVNIVFEHVSDDELAARFDKGKGEKGKPTGTQAGNRVLETVKCYAPEYLEQLEHLPEAYRAHGALLEYVRDHAESAQYERLMGEIERVMGSRSSIDEKFELLDVLDARAINGLDTREEIHSAREEIRTAEAALLVQMGRIELEAFRGKEAEAVRKYL